MHACHGYFMCLRANIYVGAQACLCMCMQRSEVDTLCLYQSISSLLSMQGFLLNLDLMASLVRLQGMFCLCLQSAGMAGSCLACLAFYVGSQEPNSGLYTYKARVLPTETSSEPTCHLLRSKFRLMCSSNSWPLFLAIPPFSWIRFSCLQIP